MALGGDHSSDVAQKLEDSGEAATFKRQGSIRKVLPSLPGASDPAQIIDRPGISGAPEIRTSLQYAPVFLEYSIMPEFNLLKSCQLPGVYVIPSARSSLKWFGVMFIRQGLYQGAVFRFIINIPDNFPDGGCPTLNFETKVFHPLVCPTSGELNVARVFHDWNKNMHHIWQVVDFARKIFSKIDTNLPLNTEAAQLYESHPDKFAQAVTECVRSSKQHLYDIPPTDDPHYLSFEPYDSFVHDPIKKMMLSSEALEDDGSKSGLSWVAPGSLKPFSKPGSVTQSLPGSLQS